MQSRTWELAVAVLLFTRLLQPSVALSATYEERSAGARVLYTGIAALANVVPLVPTYFAPQCFLGYVLCKASFAAVSLIAAGDQFFFAGDGDLEQTRALLHRGFGGDWVMTGRHVTGDEVPDLLPQAAPPAAGAADGAWEPPPR